MSNSEYRQLAISNSIAKNQKPWDENFGSNGKNSYGETLRDYIESMFPERFKYDASNI